MDVRVLFNTTLFLFSTQPLNELLRGLVTVTNVASVSDARKALFEAFGGQVTTAAATETALSVGTEYLDADAGFRTRIEDGTQYIEQSVGSISALGVGAQCPLDEAYCQQTVKQKSPLCIQDVTKDGSVSEDAIDRFGLNSYIGCRITVDGELHGTVCFAGTEPRTEQFDKIDELFVELLAQLIGASLESEKYELKLKIRNQKLKQQKQRFERISETSTDIIYRLNSAGHITYLSSAVNDVLNYAPESLLGDEFIEYLDAQSHDRARAAFNSITEGEPVTGLVVHATTANGSTVPLEVNLVPLPNDNDGDIAQGIARDVSARRQREEELRLLNRAVDSANVGIAIAAVDRADPVYTYVNDTFVNLTNYPREELLGMSPEVLFGPETDSQSIDGLYTSLQRGEASTVKTICYRSGNQPFWARISVAPVENDDGNFTHVIGFHTNITERMRTRKLFGLIDRVLRHNIRNKLSIISGFAELIGENADRSLVDRIINAADDIAAVTSSTRDLREVALSSRTPQRYTVATLLSDIISAARTTYPKAKFTLTVETTAEIVIGNEFKRAFVEVLQNAVKHCETKVPEINITACREDSMVCITIRDNGPGIDPFEMGAIAEGEETPTQHGQGVGLWLANWIVTDYAGSFQIEPITGDGQTGTVVTIKLPAVAETEPIESADIRPTVLSW